MGKEIRDQLVAAHHLSTSFDSIVEDYMHSMHRIRELEVRNAQLDKEAGEMRSENESLLGTLEEVRKASASSAEVTEDLFSLLQMRSMILSKPIRIRS